MRLYLTLNLYQSPRCFGQQDWQAYRKQCRYDKECDERHAAFGGDVDHSPDDEHLQQVDPVAVLGDKGESLAGDGCLFESHREQIEEWYRGCSGDDEPPVELRVFESDGSAFGKDPIGVGKERDGCESPHPWFHAADFIDPFGAEHSEAIEEGVAAEVVGVECMACVEHRQEHGPDAAQHACPLRQSEEERRDEVVAEEDVDVPQEGGFAPAWVEQQCFNRVANVIPREFNVLEHAGEQGHGDANQ